jgi:hypothetical protein
VALALFHGYARHPMPIFIDTVTLLAASQAQAHLPFIAEFLLTKITEMGLVT